MAETAIAAVRTAEQNSTLFMVAILEDLGEIGSGSPTHDAAASMPTAGGTDYAWYKAATAPAGSRITAKRAGPPVDLGATTTVPPPARHAARLASRPSTMM